MVDRMNAKFARAAARLDVTVDRCHGARPRCFHLGRWPKLVAYFAKSADSILEKIFLSM
jgi:hypothetical protein